MAEVLKVKRRQVVLSAGHKSREKVITIHLDANDERKVDDFRTALQDELE